MKKLPNWFRTFLEFASIIIFFIAYKAYNDDLVMATKYLMASSVISLMIVYAFEKAVPKVMLYSTILIIVCGFLVVITNNPIFIRMKPTILYILFASFLLFKLFRGQIILKSAFEKMLELTDQEWILITKRFIYFLYGLAIANEIIWRTLSDSIWIKFKLFGVPILIIVFLFFHSSLLIKNHKKTK